MSVLAAQSLSVIKSGREILREVSLTAEPGDFIVVIGPNGAGKSTLLSALAGLTAPAQGDVSLDGVLLPRMPRKALARARAYLPQNPQCEWPLSVRRLVALGLTAHLPALGSLPRQYDDAIDEALTAHDLTAQAEQSVTTLSGGEFSRAMLARALVAKPGILIVDEPVTGLDPAHAFAAMARLKAWADSGHTVIASLHDLTLAARHGSRILALKNGRVAGEGALTAPLIREVFGVEAVLRGEGAHMSVDFLGYSPASE